MQTTPRNITINDDVIINTALAAVLINTPEKSLVKWRSTGEHNLPYLKIGRNVRYRTADLRNWLESHLVQHSK